MNVLHTSLALVSAYSLGALHALEPGHGKVLVAAYLTSVNTRPWMMAFFGLFVALTHTASVLLLSSLLVWGAHSLFNQQAQLLYWLNLGAAVVIVLLGCRLVWHQWSLHNQLSIQGNETSSACSHNHLETESLNKPASVRSLLGLAFMSGLMPCSASMSIMVLALGAGQMKHIPGILGVLFIFSLGMGSVLALIGVVSAKVGEQVQQKPNGMLKWLSLLMAFSVVVFGLAWLNNALHSGPANFTDHNTDFWKQWVN